MTEEGPAPHPPQAVLGVDQWIAHPTVREPYEALLEIASWETVPDEHALGDSLSFRLYAMIGMPYTNYCRGESSKEFYLNCCRHIGELHGAVKQYPVEMAPYADCIMKLAQAMYEIDSLTSVDESPISAPMPQKERERIRKLLEQDRMHFCRLLAGHITALKEYPVACLMFTEFARVIFIFNNYQPPARTIHDAHKIPLDMKKEVDYFDEILENLEQYLASETEPPPQVEEIEEEDEPPEPDRHAPVEFECDKCGTEYPGALNKPPPACPNCKK
jgi:hypothetical protein